ncbi:MAG: hypothetical protein KME17_16845 [Cyanosarcina radialis HA8281-LM2]|jgi:hypothetical protein|nr:hypothetical protein [Cyanosarcina radialis HA8281-LM2]
MGLSIKVFNLAEIIAEDEPEFLEDYREDFAVLQAALQRQGLTRYREPESLPNITLRHGVWGFPYRDLHYLRRFYAHLRSNLQVPPPLMEGERAAEDPVIEMVSSPAHHLLYHSDCDGFYVPIEFSEVIFDSDVIGELIGSSQKLMAELLFVAPFLNIDLSGGILTDDEAEKVNDEALSEEPYATEKMVWINLFECARISIDYGTAIVFG